MKSNKRSCSINIYATHSGLTLTPRNVCALIDKDAAITIVDQDGGSVKLKLSSTDKSNCHYQSNQDHDPFLSINVCNEEYISGLLESNSKYYVLNVEKKDGDESRFALIASTNSCPSFKENRQHHHQRRNRQTRQALTTKKEHISKPDYYNNYINEKKIYVEFGLIADNSVYLKYKKDEKVINERLQAITEYINVFYSPLNIYVYLTYTEIWKDSDFIKITENSETSLFQLVDYRKKLMKVQTTDTTHLLTNVVFANGTIGKAYKGTMCANDFSVGVNMDHKDNAAFVASTVAHEMGHNFGMDHDPDDRKMYQCEGKTCLMHASSSHEMIYHWSDVSLNQLTTALNRGVNYCLLNVPKIKHGEPKCGNGIVEYGEECDCGSKLHCANDCCVASTCQLAKEAECAAGECCDTNTCKPKKRASLCRSPISDCDLPEYCDGNSQFCPMDFYVQDGSKCPLSEGSYCYSGICGDKDKQCAKLWGAEVHGSHEMCYTQLNTAGKYYGHCGYKNDTYFACSPKNALCGALMCDTEQQFAIYGDRQSILPANGHAYGKNNMDKKNCKSLRTTYSVNLKDKDPGMTPDGAPCGKDSFCVNTECRSKKNVTASLPLCSPGNCNNLGICNNVGNCHCEYGYGGIACEIPGYGGSINSGPTHDTAAFRPFLWVFWFTIIGIAMFIGATVYYKKKKDIWLPKIMWKKLRYGLNIRGVRVPVRRAPAPPSKLPKPNESLNAAWGDQPQVNATKGKHLVSSTFIPKPPSFDPPTCTYNASEKYVKFSSTKPYYTTDRPKMAPPVAPKEDSATYDCIENYDSYNEFSNSSEPPSQFYEPPNEVYTSNSNIYNDIPLNNGATIQRPCNPPPPIPKHKIKPPVAKKPQIINNTSLSNNIPPISEEPVVNNKIDVRSLAKRFENRN